jgi:tyrosine-protein kinase
MIRPLPNLEHSVSDRDQAGGMAFETLLGVLRRRLGLILLAVIVAAGGALGLSLLQDKEYSSSASMVLQASNSDPLRSLFVSPASTPDERRAAADFVVAARGVIARRTARRLERRGELDVAAAVSSVEVSAQGESDLIKVKATAKDPDTVARAANAFADEFVSFGRDAERAKIRQTQRLLRRELDRLSAARRRAIARTSSGEGGSKSTPTARRIPSLTRRVRSLESRSEDLTILASLQTGNAAVIERATPSASPSSPKPIRNTAIGGFAGLLLGLGLALVREQQDRRLRDPNELEEAFGMPVLARLPESEVLGKRSSVIQNLPPFEAEGFRMLRANLRYFEPDREIDSVLITSPSVQDGKSTVAFHLAAAAAAAGLGVLLIEADVRRPILARLLGLPPDVGLTTVLADEEIRLEDVSHEVLLARDTDGKGPRPTMDVVLAGVIPPDASELVESERMEEVIGEAKRNYSLVVIDAPPAGLVSDAIPLMSQVSAVIVVGRVGKLTSSEASRLREQLEKIKAPTVGVVANFTDAENGASYPGGYESTSARRSRSDS